MGTVLNCILSKQFFIVPFIPFDPDNALIHLIHCTISNANDAILSCSLIGEEE